MQVRLQKLIAQAGIASRRTAEALILGGSVRVNGRTVTKLGSKADPDRDRIEVDSKLLRFAAQHSYFLLNKPRNMVCTAHDPEGRPTIFKLLPSEDVRLFPVGRLPFDVEGLLVLTTDGAFADALARGRLCQTYTLKIKGRLNPDEILKLAKTAVRHQREPLRLRLLKRGPNPWYEARLVAPRSDWLRTALFRLGHPVEKIKRTGLGSLHDKALPPGGLRELKAGERSHLERDAAAGGASKPNKRKKKLARLHPRKRKNV